MSHLQANSFLIIWEVHSFNCSAVWLPQKEMKLSIVSAEVDVFHSELKKPHSTSLSQTGSFILWKSHTYTEAKQFNGSTLWKHILLFTHCLHVHAPRSYRVILSHAIKLHQQSEPKEFPSFILWEEENHKVPHVLCSSYIFYCISWFQLNSSPGCGLFHFHFLTSASQ